MSQNKTKILNCCKLLKAYKLKDDEFHKLIILIKKMNVLFEKNKTFIKEYTINM